MRKTVRSLLVGLVAILGFSVAGQTLAPTSTQPSIDGRRAPGEYSFQQDLSGMRLSLSLSADGLRLFAALEAPTTGWAALGLGSARMDGAEVTQGAISKGLPVVREMLGQGHSLRPNPQAKVTKSAVSEENGRTTLELEIPLAGLNKDGKLPLILAYGRTDDLNVRHAARASLTVNLALR